MTECRSSSLGRIRPYSLSVPGALLGAAEEVLRIAQEEPATDLFFSLGISSVVREFNEFYLLESVIIPVITNPALVISHFPLHSIFKFQIIPRLLFCDRDCM